MLGGFAGFAVPMAREEGVFAACLCGFIGAVAGYYWKFSVAVALVALAASVGYWSMHAHGYFR